MEPEPISHAIVAAPPVSREVWRDEIRADRDRHLLERMRLGLWICVLTTPLVEITEFLTRELGEASGAPSIPLNPRWVLATQMAFLVFFLVLVHRRLAERFALPAAMVLIGEVAIVTTLAGIQRGDSTSVPVLLLVLTLSTGLLFPWGGVAQLVIALLVTGCLVANLVWLEGTPSLLQPLFWSLQIGLLVSILVAHWVERTRTSIVVEICRRRLAEEELKHANAGLEERVEARTHSLAEANARLEAEIEERKRLEVEAREAREVAETANEAKSRFLAAMSHELRTPLNVTIGAADMLMDASTDPEDLKLLSVIRRSGQELNVLISDILDLTRIEEDNFRLRPAHFRVSELLDQVHASFAAQASARGLDLVVDALPEEPGMLLGDAQRVGQVLNNFLSNAVKCTESGGIHLWVRSVAEGDRRVRLRFVVDDSGRGIPPEARRRIFQAFVQLDEGPTSTSEGVGLGLAITWRLARMMEGEVGVEDSPRGGARFWFEAVFPEA